MAGMLLAILTYRPIFSTFLSDTDIEMKLGSQLPIESRTPLSRVAVAYKKHNDSIITTEEVIVAMNGVKNRTKYADTVLRAEQHFEPRRHIISNQKTLSGNIYWKFVGLVFILILYVTMVYGPIAAFLVEMFPTKIRYTSMSLPYHIGNGVFGGLVPFIGLLLTTTYPADPLVGLWYPIGVAILCFIIGSLYLENKIDKNVMD